jgi:hypothetical protein
MWSKTMTGHGVGEERLCCRQRIWCVRVSRGASFELGAEIGEQDVWHETGRKALMREHPCAKPLVCSKAAQVPSGFWCQQLLLAEHSMSKVEAMRETVQGFPTVTSRLCVRLR